MKKEDLTTEIILERVSKRIAGMSFADAWHEVGDIMMLQIVSAAMEEYRNQPSPDNTARTAEEIDIIAEDWASEFYDKDSELTSAMPESILWENRKTNFLEGFRFASQFKSNQDIKEATNCPTCGAECTIGGDGETHYYIPKKDRKEVNQGNALCHHQGSYTTITNDEGNEICCKCKKPLRI